MTAVQTRRPFIQKEIAERIIDQGGDYVLALKGNQGQLHEEVVQFFEYAQAKDFKGVPHSSHETLDADHGRIEIRRYWTVDRLDWLEDKAQWKRAQSHWYGRVGARHRREGYGGEA